MLESYLRTDQFLLWAEEYADNLATAYAPDCIILFGSVARNQHTPGSDIDILVIGGDLPEAQRDRFRLLMRLRPRFAPIQVQAFTRPEWERMLANRHVTALEALNDGIPLRGQALFNRWHAQFEGWRKLGLRRENCVWKIPHVLKSPTTPAELHELLPEPLAGP